MNHYYATSAGREIYQNMLDVENEKMTHLDPIGTDLVNYIGQDYSAGQSILEVGCGRGNIYKILKPHIDPRHYVGIEVAEHIIQLDREEFPEANWKEGSAYNIPFESASFDICYAHFVLEHLIYVEKGLEEMLRILRPGGKLILIFPDFMEANMLPSQMIGLSPLPTASQKLRKGRVLDAIISLYDSRIRIPGYLRNLRNIGPFPINANPLCLQHPEYMRPDVDALYVASKQEISQWAGDHHYPVTFPFGNDGKFRTQAFIVIHKPGT